MYRARNYPASTWIFQLSSLCLPFSGQLTEVFFHTKTRQLAHGSPQALTSHAARNLQVAQLAHASHLLGHRKPAARPHWQRDRTLERTRGCMRCRHLSQRSRCGLGSKLFGQTEEQRWTDKLSIMQGPITVSITGIHPKTL